jgi:putative ribosome biogenesis GTPase RsgA
MRINTRLDRHVGIDGQQLKEVNEFTYLRSEVTKEGGASEEIKARLQKSRNAFLSQSQVWKSSLCNVKTNVRICNSNIRPILMYGSECWKMTATDIKKCEPLQKDSLCILAK